MLKEKIKKLNTTSTFFIILFIVISSFAITYIITYKQLQKDIKLIHTTYLNNQKALMKHQVDNLIDTIETMRKNKLEDVKKRLKIKNEVISKVLELSDKSNFKKIVKIFDTSDNTISITLSDLQGNLIYTHLKDYNKTKRLKLIKKMLKNHINNTYFTHKTPIGVKITYQHIFKNYLLSTCLYQKNIDEIVKKEIIKMVNSIRFGAKNNGYISIAEVLNYKGGKAFAKVIALPVKPNMVGMLLDDDKKDITGKAYRKEYLKIINTTGEGFVSYYFYKYSDNIIRPKLSYVKLYKPFNWIIFTNVFVDDINSLIKQKELQFKKEIKELVILYLILLFIIIFFSILVVKKENQIIDQLIKNYEETINHHQTKLENLNKNLQQEVKNKTEALIKSMFTDKKTSLPNREQLLLNLKDNYVAIINIDDFKEVNDFFGIEEGDKIIIELGKFLNSIYPTYKLAADEYAIIAPTPAELKKISSIIIEKLKKKRFKIKDEEIKIRISIGIGKNLQEADTALKYSKTKKKPIIVFNKNLPILKEYENNLKWKKILDEVIEKREVIPYIQGIVDNETKEIVKYECLMRIRHNNEIYSPFFFLEISKKTHQYETLQKIMIEKCFNKFKDKNINFSINVSLSDLKNENFRDFLFEKIKEINSKNLTIEILEDEELMKDKDIHNTLNKLNEIGVKIAVDDFGSGYSNFIYLIRDIPIHTLKIDGSLIKDILKDEKLYKLIQKIVEIADSFGLETIAEFVENEEIYKKLKEIGVKYSQGYYFSKPFPIEEL